MYVTNIGCMAIAANPELEEDLARVCRELAGRCQYLEIRVEESASTDFSFQGPDLESLNQRQERGGNVRALVGGAWGFTSFNRLEEVGEMARVAIAQAALVGGGPVTLAEVTPVVDRVPAALVVDPAQLSLETKVERLRAMNAIVLGYGIPITTSTPYYQDRNARIWLPTTDGTALYQERVDVQAGVVAIAAVSGNVQRRSFSTGSSDDASLPALNEETVLRACLPCGGPTRAPKPKAGE